MSTLLGFFRISNSTPLFLGDVRLSPHEWCSFGCTKTVGRFSVRAEAHSSLPLDPWRHISAIHYGNSNCVHQKFVFFVPDSVTKSSTVDLWLIHTYIMLYYIIFYYFILFYVILYYFILFYMFLFIIIILLLLIILYYYIILCYIILFYYIILYCIILVYIILYYIIFHYTNLYLLYVFIYIYMVEVCDFCFAPNPIKSD